MFAHQIRVGRLNKDFDLDGVVVFGQYVAFDLTDLDLFVEHRAAAIQRPQSFSLECQVQAWLGVRQRRFLRQCFELARRLAITRADGNVVAGDQGFETGDTRQRNAGLDQPEAGVGFEVLLNVLVHLDGGDDPFARATLIQRQGFDLAYRHAFVDHFGLVGDDAFTTFEAHLNIDARLAVGFPAQPATDDQGNKRENPDGRPIGRRTGFSSR